MIYEDIQ